MKKLWQQVRYVALCFMGLGCVAAWPADVFVMTNIPVSAEGKTAVEARTKAIENGENQAFVELLDKIVAPADRAKITIGGHDEIAPFVRDVSVANERAGSTRYFGSLTVRFKTEPVRAFLESQGVTFLSRLPQPALLIPVYKEGTQIYVLDAMNPLWTAMREDLPASRLFQFKVSSGADDDLLPAHEAGVQYNETALKLLAQKYHVAQVMIMSVERQGTVFEVSTRVWPKNSAPEAEVSFRVTDDRESATKICADLLSDTFRTMTRKWLYLAQNSAQPIQVYSAVVPIEKVSDLSRIRRKLQQLNFAEKVDIKGFSNKRLSVDFHYRGTVTELGEKLRLNGLILTSMPDENGELIYLLTEPQTLSTDAEAKTTENRSAVAEGQMPAESAEVPTSTATLPEPLPGYIP